MSRQDTFKLGLLLFPQFSLMAFSATLEPLRAANRLLDREYYQWVILSPDGGPVVASNGIPIAAQAAFSAVEGIDLLLVCIGLDPLQVQAYPGLRGRLRQLASRGCQVGGVSGGPFLLAEAGLLDGRHCTVHWEYSDFFAARYPRAKLQQDVFVVDRGVFTCSGGTAALDMMLHFIREHHGSGLALSVAEQFIHPRIREQGDRQRMAVHTRYRITSPRLAEVIELMEQSRADAPGLRDIAARVALSTRQVERLFQRHLGRSPSQFYLELRLARARTLLRDTSQPVRAIAAECGFKSMSHFSSSYRRAYARRPTDERQPQASPPRKKGSAPGKRPAFRKNKIR
ncbi:MAG: GlxA family transcriptional regulator [Gammaproteobacteria bacterium]|nr:GlxA family transcriptional regulator [Gammaproteobacteria bacterium]MDH5273241.1 GlxA family transcriptional regulator [Gammaproteobacteria bacterium]